MIHCVRLPVAPGGPVAPADPAAPVDPVAPEGPVEPLGPVGPWNMTWINIDKYGKMDPRKLERITWSSYTSGSTSRT
jgi:hypothetical protein